MKLHKETWHADYRKVHAEDRRHVATAQTVAGAQLIAMAPSMARLLLANEWEGPDGHCASCRGGRYEDGHMEDCAWLVLMRAAGILP